MDSFDDDEAPDLLVTGTADGKISVYESVP